MCGRLNQSSSPAEIAQQFSTTNLNDYEQSYNVTPSAYCPIIRFRYKKKEMALSYWDDLQLFNVLRDLVH
ncbi:MAG: SOS response-associated peptidase family protein [Candidatus Thiodiazotropha sp.]